MYEASVSIIILVLLILVGIVAYYIYDYYSHKANVSDKINATNQDVKEANTRIDGEKKDRMDSVNNARLDLNHRINMNDIYVNNRIDDTKMDVEDNVADLDLLVSNVDKLASFSSGGTSHDILSFPGSGTPDMSLKASVAALNGLTIKDLAGNKRFKVCGTGDNPSCIEIPDNDGNVYLTPLANDKAVSINGRTAVSGVLSIKESKAAPVNGAEISGKADGTSFIKTDRLGVGNVAGSPTAALHVMTTGTVPFRLTSSAASGTSDVMSVDSTGVITAKGIKIKNPGDQDNTAFMITKDGDGNLAITGPAGKRVAITGDVRVTGGISYTGTHQQISGFTSGPIKMNGAGVPTPVDYMNAPYLVPAAVNVY